MRRPHRPMRALLALCGALALLLAACSSDDSTDDTTTGTAGSGDAPSGPTIVIGAQDFGESAILAEIYGQALADAGYDVRQQSLGGFRDIEIGAFESGDINFAPEYVASMLEFLNGQAGEATGDVDESIALLRDQLEPLGLLALDPAPGVDTNSFVISAETSEELGITSLSDLAEKGADLRLGGPADCETNPFCIPGLLEVYGVDLSGSFVALDTGVVADALDGGEIDVAVLFSTDGRIADREWVLLEDDENMLAADNIVPVVTVEVADAYGDAMVDLVNRVSALITTEALIEMNRAFDVDKESARDIARAWLEDNDLVSSGS